MSTVIPQADWPAGFPDPAALARMANDLFAVLPGTAAPAAVATTVPGVQAPANIAPPGSVLASPAGFGPSVPGTPLPQGLVPGANLVPASATQLPSLANRAPALLPHAAAGNGLPDTVTSIAPAFEPRSGGAALGVPGIAAPAPATASAVASSAGAASPFYFLSDKAQPGGPGAASAKDPLDALSRLPYELPYALPAETSQVRAPSPAPTDFSAATPAKSEAPGPSFYFVDAVRLPDGFVTPAKPGRDGASDYAGAAHPPFDVNAVRRDFPILKERVNGRPLVWFDNAATTQKPQSVIDRLSYFYEHENSNIHRAAHELAARATDAYEGAREKVARFIGASSVEEIIFVRGATEAINLVAKSWGAKNILAGDEIIVSHLEHHANIVPWQQLAAERGAKIRVIPVDDSGQVLLEEYQRLLNDKTRLVAVTQVSNALGTVVPVKTIVELAHRAGATALVDGAQSVSHMRVDVQDLGADFFVFSGHKMFAPTGIGVVYGRRELLEAMPPWQGGGNMIADVTFERTVYQPPPARFEAGTGNIADAVALGAAIDYLERVGMENIARYEHDLLAYATRGMAAIKGVRLIGTASDKASVLSFVLAGYEAEEVGKALNEEGIAVRSGHHCAQPILRRFGLEATVRPSLAFYNTYAEVDLLVSVVRRLAAQARTV
jgi:cysteine desulfurase/selenocysteine lyase